MSRSKRRAPVGALVFAYGSNLDDEQMRHRCPTALEVGRATLREHRLAFAGYSHRWGGAVATLIRDKRRSVVGSIWRIPSWDLERLDGYEGAPTAYDRIGVIVQLDGKRAANAEAYVKLDTTPGCPSRKYLESIAYGYGRLGFAIDPLVKAAVESSRAAAKLDELACVAEQQTLWPRHRESA